MYDVPSNENSILFSISYLKRDIYPVESTPNITSSIKPIPDTCNNIVMSWGFDSASSTGFEDKYKMPVSKAHTNAVLRWRRDR